MSAFPSLSQTVPEAGSPPLRLEVVRRLTPNLQRSVDAVASAAQDVDGVSPFGEHKWLRLVRGDDRCAAILLWLGERLAAAAHCDAYHTPAPDSPCRLTAEMVVHPELRRRGLGTLLLRAVMTQAREEGAAELHLWAYGNLLGARQITREVTLVPQRALWQMEMSADDLPSEPPALPENLRLRAFDPPRDAPSWLALHNRVFAAHPEQGRWDASDFQARLDEPWFDPADLLLAEDATSGSLVGFCWVKLRVDSEQPGEIYIVGVEPEARGRGLGRLLTRAGLAHMRARGRPGAMLYVESDNAPAIALYAQLGFHRRWQHVCYARELTAI